MSTHRPPLLSVTEESALILKAQGGDQSAAWALVEAFDPWLRKLARQHVRTDAAPFADLLQEARLALFLAVERVDPRGGRLATQAHKWVVGAIRDESYPTALSIPPRTFRRYWAVRAAASTPDAAALLAPSMGLSTESFWTIFSSTSSTTDAAATEVAESEELRDALRRYEVADLMDRAALDEKERSVVDAYFGLTSGRPMLDIEVADTLGLSRSSVQRVRVLALEKMTAAAA